MPIWYLDLRPKKAAYQSRSSGDPRGSRYAPAPVFIQTLSVAGGLTRLFRFPVDDSLPENEAAAKLETPDEEAQTAFEEFASENPQMRANLYFIQKPKAELKNPDEKMRAEEAQATFTTFLKDVRQRRASLVFIDVTGHPIKRLEDALGRAEGERQQAGVSPGGPLDPVPSVLVDELFKSVPDAVVENILPADSVRAASSALTESAGPALPNANELATNPIDWARSLVAAINVSEIDERPPKQAAVVICHSPEGYRRWSYQSDERALAGVCLESPDRMTRELIRWLFSAVDGFSGAEVDKADRQNDPEAFLQTLLPGRLQEVPPSLWGRYSPQWQMLAVWQKPFPEAALKPVLNVVDDDYYTKATNEAFRTLWQRLSPPGDPPLYSIGLLASNLVYVLRLCRKLATRSLEGEPFEATVVFVPDGADLHCRDATNPKIPINAWCRQLHGFVETPPPSFLFTDRSVDNHMELIQAEGLVLFVEISTLRLITVAAHWSKADWYRGMWCRNLAREFKGVVAHLRGGRYVEVYDHQDLQLWYDGFSWRAKPFADVIEYLQEFFSLWANGLSDEDVRNRMSRSEGAAALARSAGMGDIWRQSETSWSEGTITEKQKVEATRRRLLSDLVGRVIAALVGLFDHQSSSILVFRHQERTEGVKKVRLTADELTLEEVEAGRRPVLEPMRTQVRSLMRWPNQQLPDKCPPIKEISLSALHGILRLDGCHVIESDGTLTQFAQQIKEVPLPKTKSGTPTPHAWFSGTGRGAAQNLSAHIPQENGFVIKVSASGGLHVFVCGRSQNQYRPLRPPSGSNAPPPTPPPPAPSAPTSLADQVGAGEQPPLSATRSPQILPPPMAPPGIDPPL